MAADAEARAHPSASTAQPSAARTRVRSLRFRLAAIASIVVAVVLAITTVAVLTVQRRQLTANLDASLQQRADFLTGEFSSGPLSSSLATNDPERAVQLVSSSGTVLAATNNLRNQPEIPSGLGHSDDEIIETRADLPLEDDFYRLLARRINTKDGPAVLYIAENSDDLEDAMRDLAGALMVSIAAVAVALAALIWWLTGRTLNPVDRMRLQVEKHQRDQL